MKNILIFILTFLNLAIFGQNLIPNPSFEDTVSDCHYQAWVNPGTVYFGMALGWFSPSKGTPDLKAPSSRCPYSGVNFGSTGVNVYASDGNNYGAFYTYDTNSFNSNWREYVGIKFSEILNQKKYCLEFDIKLMSASMYATSIGVLISSDYIYQNSNLNLNYSENITFSNPILDTSWTRMSVEYTAQGIEEYIYIGNFHPDSTTTLIVNQGTYSFTFYCIDNLSLTLCPGQEEPSPEAHFTVYPNPSNGNTLYIDKYADTTAQISLYNALGQQVGVRNLPARAYKGVVFEQLANGVYVVVYVTANGYREEKKVVVI